MRIVVINHITLDGVLQAPGRPDEDTLILGSGQRLFDHHNHLIPLPLVDATSTPSGVLLAADQPR